MRSFNPPSPRQPAELGEFSRITWQGEVTGGKVWLANENNDKRRNVQPPVLPRLCNIVVARPAHLSALVALRVVYDRLNSTLDSPFSPTLPPVGRFKIPGQTKANWFGSLAAGTSRPDANQR
ncbi:hypothetical protein O3P69_013178 [Scylla paramamosain]|uniref:Uncharacterized protein n=1 Tax=Scylla paramamosain TaxID=85552 RepID=A0AAW0TZ47_SCYPA